MKPLFLSMVVFAAFACVAGTYVWTGEAGDGLWKSTGNWQDGLPPSSDITADDTVIVSSAGLVPGADGYSVISNSNGMKIMGQLQIAAGSGALRIAGDTLKIHRFGRLTESDKTDEALSSGSALLCLATGVKVDIAAPIRIMGGRTFTQAAGSDLTLSGGIEGEGASVGDVAKRVLGNSKNARFTLAGPSDLRTNNYAFWFRGGTNVFVHPKALGVGTTANVYWPGATLVFDGGVYSNNFVMQAQDINAVFRGDTTIAGDCAYTSVLNATYINRIYLENNPTIHVTGDMNLSNANVYVYGQGPATLRVDGKFGAKVFDCGASFSTSLYDFWFGGNADNGFTSTYMAYVNYHALGPDILNPGFVFHWGYAATNERGVFFMNGFDQTIDRFTSSKGGSDPGVGRLICTPEGKPAKLTLKASASDYCRNRLTGPLTLVYDALDSSYYQNLCTNAYEATGDIIVSNGTLRLVGPATYKNAASIRVCDGGVFEDAASANLSLANVRSIVVESGGKFKLAAGTPFPFIGDMVKIEIENGGSVDLPEGTISLDNVWVDGSRVESGKYQAEDGTDPDATKVSWVTGTGVFAVNMARVSWLNAVDGYWNDGAKWNRGVPQEGQIALLNATGASYEVSVSADAGTLKGMEMSNDGDNTTTLSVSAPMAFANGAVTLGQGAKLDISGGGVAFAATNSTDSRFTLGEGAEVNVTGGRFMVSPHATYNANYDGAPFLQTGGTLKVSGSGVMELGKMNSHVFGTGLSRFEGNALLMVDHITGYGTSFYTGPTANGMTSRVEFADAAYFWTTNFSTMSRVQIGYDYDDARGLGITNGLAVLDYSSSAHSRLGTKLSVGSDYCRGETYIHSGQVSVHYLGLDVGGFTDCNPPRTDAHGEGLLVVDGGSMYVRTISLSPKNIPAASYKRLEGLIVGAGWNTKGQESASWYKGRIELSGGAITNDFEGDVIVLGAGRGEGEFVQTGGNFRSVPTNNAYMVLGFEGGKGLYALTNGTALLRRDIFVGGIATNTIHRNLAGVCRHRHDATGELILAGGKLTSEKDVVVSADGSGTMVVAPGGNAAIRNLVLSNGTEQAACSVLRYEIGPDGTTGKVKLSGNLVITDGARLEVDFGAYPGRKANFPLLECNGVEGGFNDENVTFLNADAATLRGAKLVQTETGLTVHVVRGMTISFR